MFENNRFEPVVGSYNPVNGARMSVMSLEAPTLGKFPTNSVLEAHLIQVKENEGMLYYCAEVYKVDEGIMRFGPEDSDGDRMPMSIHPAMLVQAEQGNPFGRFLIRMPMNIVVAQVIDNETGKQQLAFPSSLIFQLWLPPSRARMGNAPPMPASALIAVTAHDLWRGRAVQIMSDMVNAKSAALREAVDRGLEAKAGIDKDDTSPEVEKMRRILSYAYHVEAMGDLQEIRLLECMSVLSMSATKPDKLGVLPLHTYASVQMDALNGSPMLGANSFFGGLMYRQMREDDDDLSARDVYGMNEFDLANLLSRIPGGEDVESGSENPMRDIQNIDDLLTQAFFLLEPDNEEQGEAFLGICGEVRRLKSFSDLLPNLVTKAIASNLIEQFAKSKAEGGFPDPASGRVITSCAYQLLDVRQIMVEIGSRDEEDVIDHVVKEYLAQRAEHYDGTIESMSDVIDGGDELYDDEDIVDQGDDEEMMQRIRDGVSQAVRNLLDGNGESSEENDDAFRSLMEGLF